MKSKILNLLTICRKAGKIGLGYDSMESAVLSGKCKLIIVADDASDRTKKSAGRLAENYNVPIIFTECTKEDILEKCGKASGVLTVNDSGFAKAFLKRSDAKK